MGSARRATVGDSSSSRHTVLVLYLDGWTDRIVDVFHIAMDDAKAIYCG